MIALNTAVHESNAGSKGAVIRVYPNPKTAVIWVGSKVAVALNTRRHLRMWCLWNKRAGGRVRAAGRWHSSQRQGSIIMCREEVQCEMPFGQCLGCRVPPKEDFAYNTEGEDPSTTPVPGIAPTVRHSLPKMIVCPWRRYVALFFCRLPFYENIILWLSCVSCFIRKRLRENRTNNIWHTS